MVELVSFVILVWVCCLALHLKSATNLGALSRSTAKRTKTTATRLNRTAVNSTVKADMVCTSERA